MSVTRMEPPTYVKSVNTVEFPEWPRLRAMPPRAEGVHISDIIRYITEKMDGKSGCGWDMGTTQRVGWLFEEALALAYQEGKAPGVGSFSLDGIWMTPDGYDPLTYTVHEYKLTWRSSRTFMPYEDFKYMTQVKGYCHGMGVTKAMLHVLFIMGDYRQSGPEYRQYELEFHPHELLENWKMLLAHKPLVEKEKGQ